MEAVHWLLSMAEHGLLSDDYTIEESNDAYFELGECLATDILKAYGIRTNGSTIVMSSEFWRSDQADKTLKEGFYDEAPHLWAIETSVDVFLREEDLADVFLKQRPGKGMPAARTESPPEPLQDSSSPPLSQPEGDLNLRPPADCVAATAAMPAGKDIPNQGCEAKSSRRRNGGRPPQYDWRQAITDLATMILRDGVPKQGDGRQAEMERHVMSLFPPDKSPSDTTVQNRVAAFLKAQRGEEKSWSETRSGT